MAQQERRGKLVVISGFSGAGKGTMMRMLTEQDDNYVLSVSMTTRQPREGEVNGKDYFFVSNEEFEEAIRENKLLEHAGYVDHYYGTPAAFVAQNRDNGKDVLLEIEVQGAMQVREKTDDAILIFIMPPTARDLLNRLVGRGSEDMGTITKRLEQALVEASYMPKYDYIIVNDDLEKSTALLDEVIQTEPDAYHYDAAQAEKFVGELKEIIEELKGQAV